MNEHEPKAPLSVSSFFDGQLYHITGNEKALHDLGIRLFVMFDLGHATGDRLEAMKQLLSVGEVLRPLGGYGISITRGTLSVDTRNWEENPEAVAALKNAIEKCTQEMSPQ